MSTTTFDTLKLVERLEKAGASRELASAMVEAQKESLSEVMDAKFDTLSWMMGILIALAVAHFAKQFF